MSTKKKVLWRTSIIAVLQFSFWSDTAFPVTTQTLAPDEGGVFTVVFIAKNVSDMTATRSADIWVYVCDDCEIVEAPKGFDQPQGLHESARHKVVPNLNPGVTFEKMTIKLKLKRPLASFEVGFRYACETCGKMKEIQRMTVLISSC